MATAMATELPQRAGRAPWAVLPAAALALLLSAASVAVTPAPPPTTPPGASLFLEELTWTELRDRQAAGTTTVLVPIGGTEQSGPHIALGKHNTRVRLLAGLIAQQLGHTVVAPVLAYVPEGAISPPAAHMRFTGTLSIPDTVFEAVLEATARSLRQHGFRDVALLGDHGGYQKSLDKVAARLNREWAGAGLGAAGPRCRVHALADYYHAAQAGHAALLAARGFSTAEIGSHAGLADTALMLATDPALVRKDQLLRAAKAGASEGVAGDPRRATAELGQIGVDHIVEASVAALRKRIAGR